MMVEIDVHGMTKSEAKLEIERLIASLDESIKEIRIIHGYRSGQILREAIQGPHFIRSKRFKRKKFTMNRGETIYELY
jgi:DNA-nicking Smr family endonuclease